MRATAPSGLECSSFTSDTSQTSNTTNSSAEACFEVCPKICEILLDPHTAYAVVQSGQLMEDPRVVVRLATASRALWSLESLRFNLVIPPALIRGTSAWPTAWEYSLRNPMVSIGQLKRFYEAPRAAQNFNIICYTIDYYTKLQDRSMALHPKVMAASLAMLPDSVLPVKNQPPSVRHSIE